MKIYLDLLPTERKQELKRKKVFRQLLREQFLFLLPLVVFLVILFNVQYILNVQLATSIASHSLEQSRGNYQQLTKFEEKFTNVNSASTTLLKIQTSHLYWLNVFRALDSTLPSEITITNLSTKNYQILLSGKAKTREDLLKFKDNLQQTSCFKDVNVPLSNLVVKDDVAFQMDFTVNEACLKKSN